VRGLIPVPGEAASRFVTMVAVAAMLTSSSGCRRGNKEPATIEPGVALASTVLVADPRFSVQLVKGFHEVESGAWRWTMGRFAVNLQPPVSAATKGALLVMKFTIPEIIIKTNKDVTINATVNGERLAPVSYGKVGDYLMKLNVPAKALNGDAVRCEFVLDKTLPPSTADQRELGVIVASIGLQRKP